MKFEKIESIQTQVVYASSQESGEGDASHLTDGDPNTIWHTMYSVTVAKYPHWVDLDAGESKALLTCRDRMEETVISRITLFRSAWMEKNGESLLIKERSQGTPKKRESCLTNR